MIRTGITLTEQGRLVAVLAATALCVGLMPGNAQDASPAPWSAASGANVLGQADAPVTLVQYASVTCGHCASFHNNVFSILEDHYIDTGLVRYEYRFLPTPPAELSYLGSAVAVCAGQQAASDGFFSIIDDLYEHRADWLTPDYQRALQGFVADAGVEDEEIVACLGQDTTIERINADVATGRAAGVKATPTFLIDGEILTGYDNGTFQGFFEVLDAKLTEAGATPPTGRPAIPAFEAHSHGAGHEGHDH